MLKGLCKPTELIVIVVISIGNGCPAQTIAHADHALTSAPWPTGESEPTSIANTCIATSSDKGNWNWCMCRLVRIWVKGRQMIETTRTTTHPASF